MEAGGLFSCQIWWKMDGRIEETNGFRPAKLIDASAADLRLQKLPSQNASEPVQLLRWYSDRGLFTVTTT